MNSKDGRVKKSLLVGIAISIFCIEVQASFCEEEEGTPSPEPIIEIDSPASSTKKLLDLEQQKEIRKKLIAIGALIPFDDEELSPEIQKEGEKGASK